MIIYYDYILWVFHGQVVPAFPHSTDGLIRHPALPGIGIFLQPLAGCVLRKRRKVATKGHGQRL